MPLQPHHRSPTPHHRLHATLDCRRLGVIERCRMLTNKLHACQAEGATATRQHQPELQQGLCVVRACAVEGGNQSSQSQSHPHAAPAPPPPMQASSRSGVPVTCRCALHNGQPRHAKIKHVHSKLIAHVIPQRMVRHQLYKLQRMVQHQLYQLAHLTPSPPLLAQRQDLEGEGRGTVQLVP